MQASKSPDAETWHGCILETSMGLRVLHRVGGITLELVSALHGRALLQLHCLTLCRSMLLLWCPTSACTLEESLHRAESRA